MTNHSGVKNKDRLIKGLLEVVKDIQLRYQAEDDEEKQWLIQNSPNPAVAELVKEMTVMMLHVLDAIGQLEPVNGITISKKFGYSKGSISKITRKLADKQIILFEYLPDNKKEILFRTTSLGKEIYRLHEALHHQIDIGVNRFLQQYNEDELSFLVNALSETLHTSWVYPETKEESIAPSQRAARTNEETDNDKSLRTLSDTEEMNEIMAMLKKLDSHNLKKAKVILNDTFSTPSK
ncbi:MarR family transcriptional regulator [Paenibacillus sp. BIHB 4019]|uniref:MarR family transcriptional regulator n=1 Tax=Paenibacillus sp. BIHB 4019 TaxID=1870819 RepID=A0A1B2DK52_9BACL|nr:MarR family transcriptional regulator [Paenibacillus sp. BIHB 4019]ANY68092.1 MarR family transcriptional regulator [Paenibacillus sp. BIHB 4019]